jgi:hypothetical protein
MSSRPTPAKAGGEPGPITTGRRSWVPACAGTTGQSEPRVRSQSSRCQTAYTYSFPRPHCCVRALPLCFTHPPSRGGRSAERRSGVCETPVGHAMTRRVRRLRGALRPMTRDARLSALHRGGFGHRVRAFQSPNTRLGSRFSGHPDPSQRAPRSQVIVPDGRGPGPPGASGYKPPPQDATPRSAFRMSPETPLKERGCESCSINSKCSQ